MTKETEAALANAREAVTRGDADYLQRAICELAGLPRGCGNDPCPACGGRGPEGEWSEGSEVRCVDCGVALVVDEIETCNGRSSFSVLAPDDEDGKPEGRT